MKRNRPEKHSGPVPMPMPMPDVAAEIRKFDEIMLRAGSVFSPAAPIDQRQLFSGRIHQLQTTIDAIGTKGQHVVLYGERGVGKTSLASIVGPVLQTIQQGAVTVRENCHYNDTFAKLWHRALDQIRFEISKPRVGFSQGVQTTITSLAKSLPACPGPDDIITLFRRLPNVRLVVIFDEFDTLADRTVTRDFAETIKALSDYAVPVTIVLVGVGDSIDQLIESHASIERAIVQVPLPRMQPNELGEIITRASGLLGVSFADGALDRVVRISQGLPHYVHLLALHATRSAAARHSLMITLTDVNNSVDQALKNANQSVLEAYMSAVSSPQKGTLFKDVLLACALAKTDDLGSFAPADVRLPLREMGQDLEIPAFASHLNKFTGPDRGQVLQKKGVERRYRYRFRNPLLQPFVIMKGVRENLITFEQVERLVGVENAPKPRPEPGSRRR